MRDFDENNITAAVVNRFADRTARQRNHDQLGAALARVCARCPFVVRGVELCRRLSYAHRPNLYDQRQEFILLSDTLGLSMLVDAIDHPASAGVTEFTVLGPFYVSSVPEVRSGPTSREA